VPRVPARPPGCYKLASSWSTILPLGELPRAGLIADHVEPLVAAEQRAAFQQLELRADGPRPLLGTLFCLPNGFAFVIDPLDGGLRRLPPTGRTGRSGRPGPVR
jgi:hypothetical protein